MTLDGMDELIKQRYWSNKEGRIDVRYNKKKVHIIKYADDFIVTASDRETLVDIKGMLREYLIERGLELSEEKTKITRIEDGFNFLGWNFRKYSGKLLIKPSKKSIQKVTKNVSEIIKKCKGSKQESLIQQLNPVIKGWSEYHHAVCAKEVFSKVDNMIWEMLWSWAKRRHSNQSKKWKTIKNREKQLRKLGTKSWQSES